jgi:acetolactate synthase I/II/III large subunit
MWVFEETNLAQAAEALGCMGIRVEHPSELRGALERALGANRPVVVDVASDIEAMAPRPWG